MSLRTFTELDEIDSFEGRFEYLSVDAVVGRETFGHERYLNQHFYRSPEWRRARNEVIERDNGCDMAMPGFEIFSRIIVHHMNPMTIRDVEYGNPDIVNPEYLISVTHDTHNAIHFGDRSLLKLPIVERRPNDHIEW